MWRRQVRLTRVTVTHTSSDYWVVQVWNSDGTGWLLDRFVTEERARARAADFARFSGLPLEG